MSEHRISRVPFASVYPLYVTKAERKGRTRDEVDELAKGRPLAKVLRKDRRWP